MLAVATAIINASAGTTFATSVSNRLYNTIAPQGVTFPYVVFTFVADTYEYQFREDFEDILLQFSIFSAGGNSSVEIEGIYDNLISTFDWCDLQVAGYSTVWMRREQSRELSKDVDGIWMKIVEYKLFLERDVL